MEVIDRVIVSLIYYNACVRDTLEYCLPKESFDVNVYEHKKNVLTNDLKIQSPLKVSPSSRMRLPLPSMVHAEQTA